MKKSKKKKIKHITRLIQYLEHIKKQGGEVDTFSISAGIREATPMDKEWDDKSYKLGFSQKVPDGTFSMVITGHKKQTK